MQQNLPEKHILSDSTKSKIQKALELVMTSELFSRSAVLKNFLKFIVEETLKGNTDGLKEYTIAVNALGKPDDFNPQIDAIVRIHAGRLRRLLNEYYRGPGVSDQLKIEVIKGTYVPVFRKQAISHLLEKPHKETTLAQVQKSEVKVDTKPPVYTRSKLTLAILPFRNLWPNGEYQFFVDGFGEELTQLFSNFQDIDVIAHHSARKYADNPEDVRIIGSDLGVHYIITGSVKRSSENIRVNAQLIKTVNGMQIWSNSYSYPLNIENLTSIQDQIVENICFVLGGYYGCIIKDNSKSTRQSASNINSFDAAFWNYYFHMNYSKETYMKTREALERAVESDPNYATGLVMLAELYVLAQSLGYPTVKEPLKVALELTQKALRIDPQCQHANREYGWLQVYLQNKDEAIKGLEYALSLNPTSVSLMGGIGFNLACAGEYKRAEVLLTKSFDLNPHCPWWFYFGFFLVHFHKKNYKKALEYANKIEPVDVFLDPLTKASAKGQLGMIADAQDHIRLLNESFSEKVKHLYPTLDAFLLDKPLIKDIIEGAKKAGLHTA